MLNISGGIGVSVETAIKINGMPNALKGAQAEHEMVADIMAFLGFPAGTRSIEGQALKIEGDKKYDVLTVAVKGSDVRREMFFDCTDYFGRL